MPNVETTRRQFRPAARANEAAANIPPMCPVHAGCYVRDHDGHDAEPRRERETNLGDSERRAQLTEVEAQSSETASPFPSRTGLSSALCRNRAR